MKWNFSKKTFLISLSLFIVVIFFPNLTMTPIFLRLSTSLFCIGSIVQLTDFLFHPFLIFSKKCDQKKYFYITQSPLSISTFFLSRFFKDRASLFKVQFINVLSKCAKKKKQLPYYCISHAYTYSILKKFEQEGYIKNLKFYATTPMKISFLRGLYGLDKRQKLIPMRHIDFEYSGKSISIEELKDLMRKFHLSEEVFRISRGKVHYRLIRKRTFMEKTRSELLHDLQKEKESLLDINQTERVKVKKKMK